MDGAGSPHADIGVDNAAGSTMTYSCTFGHFSQTGPWLDVRSMSWPDLAALLTRHEIGAKEGTCIVPATFTGTRRHKNDAARIEVVMLDSDAGATLQENTAAVAERGWSAAVTSTYSHLTTRTRAKRGPWDTFRLAHPDAAAAPAAFLEHRGMHPRIAEGGTVVEETDEHVIFQHQPCPKFRVEMPLLRPWVAAGYDSQHEANATWKALVEALAAALRLDHDQSCTDTSRLFYLPRHAADAPPAECAILDGSPCDIFVLPAAPGPQSHPRAERRSARKKQARAGMFGDPANKPFTDLDTGEIIDLQTSAHGTASRFEFVKALKARRPDVFVGKVTDASKHHIRCVNEDQHTNAGADAATMVINASDSSSAGFVHHCRHAHCDDVDRLVFLRRMLEQGWLKVADLTNANFIHGDAPLKATIRYVGGKLPGVVDQAEQALMRAELGLFQRGEFLVRPGVVRISVRRRDDIAAHRILELRDRALVEAMTRAADWLKYDKRSEEWVSIDAPLPVAVTYLQRVGRWRLPVLTGLINAPTLRPDGSVLAKPGYDQTTGLLLQTRGVTFPDVPERPSQDDGYEALSILLQLIATFPFVGEADRAVALSAILTACIRRSLGTAPLHSFFAPIMGSGKSKLVDLPSMIAGGREAAVISQGKTEEELEKRLGALLLAGKTVIPIDNCEAPLGGEFLCAMLTQRTVRARILGRSEAPELPSNAMVTATGNNLVLVVDMTRRAVLCRLDPRCERPELRTFSTDPVEEIKADRPRYLIAALTALKAYHLAGQPRQAEPLGSFGDWSRWVRDALIWYGQSDPVATLEAVRAQDPRLDALMAVVTQWWAVIGDERVSVYDVIQRATAMRAPLVPGFEAKPSFQHPAFRKALLQVAGDGGNVNSRRLSRWISSNENRIVGGVTIVPDGVLTGFRTWKLTGTLEQPDDEGRETRGDFGDDGD